LIPLVDLVNKYNLHLKGVLHIGAHECEEMGSYLQNGISYDNVLWIEGQKQLCDMMKSRDNRLKIYNVVVSDKDGEKVQFIVTNNYQSSSILELEDHKIYHPQIHEIGRFEATTKTIDTFFEEIKEDSNKYNMINIDIQGAELLALKGMPKLLNSIDYLYLEVNEAHLYKNCALIEEIDDFVKKFGFQRVQTVMTDYKWGDAFYIKNEISAQI